MQGEQTSCFERVMCKRNDVYKLYIENRSNDGSKPISAAKGYCGYLSFVACDKKHTPILKQREEDVARDLLWPESSSYVSKILLTTPCLPISQLVMEKEITEIQIHRYSQ